MGVALEHLLNMWREYRATQKAVAKAEVAELRAAVARLTERLDRQDSDAAMLAGAVKMGRQP
jgi:hypothetical protein